MERADVIAASIPAAILGGIPSTLLFWVYVLVRALPRGNPLPWAIAALAAIAVLDLRVIAPLLFPEVAALPFWPQFADHLAFGAIAGLVLRHRWRSRRLELV